MEFFYRRSGNFLMVIECHLFDSDYRGQFFSFTERLIKDKSKITSDDYLTQILNYLLLHLEELVNIDEKKAANLIVILAGKDHKYSSSPFSSCPFFSTSSPSLLILSFSFFSTPLHIPFSSFHPLFSLLSIFGCTFSFLFLSSSLFLSPE